MSDLTKGSVSWNDFLDFGLDEINELLEDAVEWRREVNRAMKK